LLYGCECLDGGGVHTLLGLDGGEEGKTVFEAQFKRVDLFDDFFVVEGFQKF
jgi:hypothetical protein